MSFDMDADSKCEGGGGAAFSKRTLSEEAQQQQKSHLDELLGDHINAATMVPSSSTKIRSSSASSNSSGSGCGGPSQGQNNNINRNMIQYLNRRCTLTCCAPDGSPLQGENSSFSFFFKVCNGKIGPQFEIIIDYKIVLTSLK